MDKIWPLTVTADRYGGVYSGGAYLAWNCCPWEVPQEAFGDDLICGWYWNSNTTPVGIGETPERAVGDLQRKLFHEKGSEGTRGTEGGRRVLLLVDVQSAFLNERTQPAVEFIRGLLERERFDLVIRCCWENRPGSRYETVLGYRSGADRAEALPLIHCPGSPVLVRATYSAVNQQLLSLIGPEDRLYVAGLETDACVLATLFALWDRGFWFRVYEKGVASDSADLSGPALELIRRQFGQEAVIS